MATYQTKIDALNHIVGLYGGAGSYQISLDALNAIVVAQGSGGGFDQDLDAINEWVRILGGTGNFDQDLAAYNEISRLLGGASEFDQAIDALNEIASLSLGGGGTVTITSNGGGPTASISVEENQTAVTTVVATQAAPSGAITYSISGGVDAALFEIDEGTGVLTFIEAPVYVPPVEPPVISNLSLSGSLVVPGTPGPNVVSLSVDTTVSDGELFYVITTSDAAPTAAQIKAGQDELGGSVGVGYLDSVNVTATPIEFDTAAIELEEGTLYYAHAVQVVDAQDSNVTSTLDFSV